MVLGQETSTFSTNGHASADHARFLGRLVRKRDGRLAPFDRSRIAHAVEMAVRAELGCPYPDPIASAAAIASTAAADNSGNLLDEVNGMKTALHQVIRNCGN